MEDLLVTINVRLQYNPNEEDICIKTDPKSLTQMDIVLKSELFRDVSRSCGLLHVEP